MTRRTAVQTGMYGVGAAALLAAGSRDWWVDDEQPPVHARGTTLDGTIRPARQGGYRRLVSAPGEAVVVRDELAGAHRGRTGRRTGLAAVVQVTDLHVVDTQNPMRCEYLDRQVRTAYRPQELLAPQGTTALVEAVNGLGVGPLTGRPLDAVVATGDLTDNHSGTELDVLLGVLAGGIVRPDTGGAAYEGVANAGLWDHWQPGSTEEDRYRRAGFPHLPGLVEAAMRPFVSPGFAVPWLVTMGNHDDTALGTLMTRPYAREWAVGDRKIFDAAGDATVHLAELASCLALEPRRVEEAGDLLRQLARRGDVRTVTPDPRRAPFTTEEYLAALRAPAYAGAGPVGHGFPHDADAATLYYAHRLGEQVVAVSLDTTNQAGGADGSIGAAQLAWLRRTLAAHADDYVLVFSHHPSWNMTNLVPDPRLPDERRHDGDAVLAALHENANVLAWVNGHCHSNRIVARGHHDPRRAFWEVNTVSHVDAPQQARIIEVAHNHDGTVSLLTTMLDAASPLQPAYDERSTAALGGLYRELAFNDLGQRDRSGRRGDRNTELLLPDPLA
ncbi:metallophosphoesterase [Nocardioides phosphati]|uniref:Metallophosphoesterase n=1 Tax=Nocardioides phosphati TaxID=1867775 RepID=A0ABQ2NBL5_9ACTN|nr:TIGR03767 family metallophosphoesterase [Nocardioides phosphati]GGO88701.1 metallophosphoesterase [Nocardioides phosphati]